MCEKGIDIMPMAVAIDGPAGAGKSTIARTVSKRLGFIYVDTGALYRATALASLRAGIDISDGRQIEELLGSIRVELTFDESGEQVVLLNGKNVGGLIRTPEVSMQASAVSAIPRVRAFLLDLQRNTAKTSNVIMDGRDIATVVLPDAQVKIFLTASPEVRAERRRKELCEKGQNVTFEEVLNDVKTRDYNDSHREIAPLKPAPDSVIADTSDLTFDQSADLIESIIRQRLLLT